MFKLYKLLPVVMLAFLALPCPALAGHTQTLFSLHNQRKAGGGLNLAVLRKEDGAFETVCVGPGMPPKTLPFKDWTEAQTPRVFHYQVMVVPDGRKKARVIASLTTANELLDGPRVTKCEARIEMGTSCTVEARKEHQTSCHMIIKCPGKNPAAATD